MSYQAVVRRGLKGVADVVGPAENGQYSLYTLSSLARWLTQLGKPNIVHWNNGIHDSGHNPKRSPIQIPVDMYRANLEFILKQLLDTGALVIWATTTPVHPDRPFRDDQWSWRNQEIDQYNSVAQSLMQEYGIAVNDLHAIVGSDPNLYLSEDQLHRILAVVESIHKHEPEEIAERMEKLTDLLMKLGRHIENSKMTRKDKDKSKDLLNRIVLNVYAQKVEVKDEWASLETME